MTIRMERENGPTFRPVFVLQRLRAKTQSALVALFARRILSIKNLGRGKPLHVAARVRVSLDHDFKGEIAISQIFGARPNKYSA